MMGFFAIYENSDLAKDRKMTIFFFINRDPSELLPSKDVKIYVESY